MWVLNVLNKRQVELQLLPNRLRYRYMAPSLCYTLVGLTAWR
jgi:hypothetical protein